MSVTGVRFDDVRAFQASLGGLVPQSVVCTLGNAAVNYLDLPGGTWWQCWCPDGVAGKTITLKWLACAADGTQSTTTLGTITLPSGAGSAQVLQSFLAWPSNLTLPLFVPRQDPPNETVRGRYAVAWDGAANSTLIAVQVFPQ